MPLISVADAVQDLGLPTSQIAAMTPVMTNALFKAQTRLETELDTRLERLNNVEVFHADSDQFCGVNSVGPMKFRLRNGFVSGTVSVETSDAWDDNFAPLDGDYVKVQADKGFMFVDAALVDRKYVKVSYTSGFVNKTDLNPIIKSALLTFLPMVLQASQNTEANKGVDEAYRRAGDLAAGMVQGFNRVTGFAFYPIHYESVTPTT